jgi:DNA polymerase III subunit chi
MAAKVEVLTGVANRLLYVCKFLRKSMPSSNGYSNGHLVCGPQDELQRLDALLWSFDAHSFLAHAWAGPAARTPEVVRARTQIWLATHCDVAAGCTVLVNLNDEAPEGWQAFERVVEFVGSQEHEVAAGRRRWKTYGTEPGVERIHHAVKADTALEISRNK